MSNVLCSIDIKGVQNPMFDIGMKCAQRPVFDMGMKGVQCPMFHIGMTCPASCVCYRHERSPTSYVLLTSGVTMHGVLWKLLYIKIYTRS